MKCFACDREKSSYEDGKEENITVAEVSLPGGYTQVLCLYCASEVMHRLQATDEFKAMLKQSAKKSFIKIVKGNDNYIPFDPYTGWIDAVLDEHAEFLKLYPRSKAIVMEMKKKLSSRE